MASIETLKHKRTTAYVICFRRNGKRQKLYLGCAYTKRDAERLRDAIDSALKAEKKEEPLDRATSLFFENLTADMRRRLIKAGLIRGALAISLQEAKDRFFAERAPSLKYNTVKTYKQAFRVLETVVSPDTRVDMITRETILTLRDQLSEVYKPAYVDGHLTRLNAFFEFLKSIEVIETSPLSTIPTSKKHQAEREHVPAETVIKCFEHLTIERRAVLALWRFAGLRREEPRYLTRSCVDLEKRRLTVFSPKTEHTGHDKRVVPIGDVLFPILEEYLKGFKGDVLFPSLISNGALDTAFRKAGVSWRRRAQNLRVSCENDWLEQRIPAHVVAKWLGHTTSVQAKHYAIVLDSYFEEVTGRK